ncbi:MAG: DUF7619 domain-containing protein [Bacteroidales bacterium]
MRTILTFITMAVLFNSNLFSQNLNDSCLESLQICSGYTYSYPLNINTTAQTGPNYGCLYTQPNPAWYFIKVASGGDFIFNIVSPTGNDVDFACWGPFQDPSSPCVLDLTAACTNCPNNTADSTFYPSGNLVDCSYDPAATETLHILNAQPNEYYIVVITNYSNQPGTVSFFQSNAGQAGAGEAECNDVATISGRVYIDNNSNQIFDGNDIALQYAMIESPKCGDFYFMTDQNGIYNGYVCYTPDTIRPYVPIVSPYIQSITPSFYAVNNDLSNADFAVELQPNICDVGVYMAQQSGVSMWNNSLFGISLVNFGTTEQYINLTLTLDTNFDYVSASINPTTINGNILTWDSLYLPLFSYMEFNLTLMVNDTTLTTTTPYSISAIASINCSDVDTTDNIFVLNGAIGTSYDPNYIEVNPLGEISSSEALSEKEFIYTIHFQNTGSAPAHNITIVDTLSNWLNIPSFTFLGSSHPCTYQVSEHSRFTFNFYGIDLPDSNTNELESHGYVMFKVKCLPSLANGGEVYNKAFIYFDSNPGVETNTVLTYVRNATNINPIAKPLSSNVSISPNPVVDYFTIQANSSFNKIEFYNAESKLIRTEILNENKSKVTLNKDELKSGIYLIKVYTNKGKILQSKMVIK